MLPHNFEESFQQQGIPDVGDLNLIEADEARASTDLGCSVESRVKQLLGVVLVIEFVDIHHKLVEVDSPLVLHLDMRVEQIHHKSLSTTRTPVQVEPPRAL